MRDCAVMKSRGVFGMLCCASVLLADMFSVSSVSSVARADQGQFVLIDATFTAAANNTTSSEYAVAPLEGAPANWRFPIDYSAGGLHVRVEVLEKPSQLKTLCNVCLKANNILTCQPYPPPYTKPGVYTSDAYFSSFWQFDDYDWTRPVERVNVVVKDENGRFVQGNPAYFPTKMRVTVTVVPPGERFVEADPLAEDDSDAGVLDHMPSEPASPAVGMTRNASTAAGAGAVAVSAQAAAGAGAALVAGASAAGHGVPVPGASTDRSVRDYLDKGSSCSAAQARPKARYGVCVALAFFAVALWRRTTRRARVRRSAHRHFRGVRSHGRRWAQQ